MSFDTQLRDKAAFVNNTLRLLLSKQPISGELREALVYVIEAPGKRIRSALVLWCCELISGAVNHNAEISAAAIEMVHTYSLVHDDLPAMDDDDLRRGLPACHKRFDEATAILTGDALLTLAFEVLAKEIDEPRTALPQTVSGLGLVQSGPAVAVRLIGRLAQAAGPAGMIAGQLADLKAENGRADERLLESIHTNKTAKMFRCAAACGAICGGADEEQLQCLCEYGLKIGLGFQIADDILDVSATSQRLGKTAGKDAKAGKMTYPKLLGLEKSRHLAGRLADEAAAVLTPFGKKADTLRQLATALLKRTR